MICVNVYSENCILKNRYNVSSSDYINSYSHAKLTFHLHSQNYSHLNALLYLLSVYFCPLRPPANTLFLTKSTP